MRVLHLIDTTGPGGAETVFVELCAGLSAFDVESIPCVLGPGWLFDTLRARGLDPRIVPSPGRTLDVAYLRALVRTVRGRDIDLIQTHLLGSAVYGALAGALTGRPVVSTFHGTWDLEHEGRLAWVKHAIIRHGVSRLVFVSSPLRDAFLAHARLPAEKSAVIPNGIDFEVFKPSDDRSFRRSLGIPGDDVLVCAVGNVRPAKRYDVFLEAAALVRKRSDRFHFAIVGDPGPGGEGLGRIARDLGVADRVHFAGFRDDVAAVMQSADIYVSTSDSEGFSLTTVQALACGVPVVATRSGGPETIVRDGDTGTLVDVGSPHAVAEALVALGLESERRRRCARAARVSVVDRFSLPAMSEAYARAYVSLTSRASTSANTQRRPSR